MKKNARSYWDLQSTVYANECVEKTSGFIQDPGSLNFLRLCFDTGNHFGSYERVATSFPETASSRRICSAIICWKNTVKGHKNSRQESAMPPSVAIALGGIPRVHTSPGRPEHSSHPWVFVVLHRAQRLSWQSILQCDDWPTYSGVRLEVIDSSREKLQ